MRLLRSDVLLVIVDMQERLLPVIDRHEAVTSNVERLIRGARVLDIPLLITEQYVKGLGPTVASLREALEQTSGYRPIAKSSFSAYANGEFQAELRSIRRKHIVLCGIETHVCVYQTATDLLAAGQEVTLVGDAVSSRVASNREIALQRLTSEGARLSSTEMLLFELLGESDSDTFRAVLKIVK